MPEGMIIAMISGLAGGLLAMGHAFSHRLRPVPAFIPSRPPARDTFHRANQQAESESGQEFDTQEFDQDAELKTLNHELESINDDLKRLKESVLQMYPQAAQQLRQQEQSHTGRINQLINQFLEHTNWSEWQIDQTEAFIHPPKSPSVYEIWDKEIVERHGRLPASPDPSFLGMVKFTHEGECVTLPTHTRLSAVAYELEMIYQAETGWHPLESPQPHVETTEALFED